MPVEFFKDKNNHKNLRSKKIEQVLLDIINQLLAQDLQMSDETMITITKAKLNESVTYLDLTISAYGKASIKEVLEFLEENRVYIKSFCAKNTHLKYMPEIRFHEDKSIRETLKWDQLT